MGKPILIYGLADLDNPSFEADAALDPPSSWDTTASVNGINEISATEYQSAGDGIPSARSLRQNVDDGTAGNIAVCRQRFAAPTLAAILDDADQEIAIAAMLKAENETGHQNATLRIRQYDSTGTETPGTGVELTAVEERRFETAGPEWSMLIYAAKIVSGVAWFDVELVYDISVAGYDANGSVWWDRVFAGGLVDLRAVTVAGMQFDVNTGVQVNEGDGVSEAVRVRRPRTQIDLDLANLIDGHHDQLSMAAFRRWLNADAGLFAFWRDRDRITNAGHHFQECAIDRSLRVVIPVGVLRDNYRLRMIANSEGP